MWIVFEGPDCVGKSTIIRRLSEKLRDEGFKVITTSEPTNSKIGQLIRDWLLKNMINPPHIYALLFTADRYYHYYNEIKMKLKEGYIVLQERYKLSTIVYQSMMGLEIEWLEELNKYLPEPDITIILDAKPETILQRLRSRLNREVFENLEFISKIREAYLKICKKKKYILINTEDDINNIVENVYRIIIKKLTINTQDQQHSS